MTGRTTVSIAHLAVMTGKSGELVTHSLGSCIGVTLFDPVAKVGGLLHFMLPMPGGKNESAAGPGMYCSDGVPLLFKTAYAQGAEKSRLIVCAAGGAQMIDTRPGLAVGQRNRTILRKLLWKNSVVLAAEDTGGNAPRTMSLDLATGRVSVSLGSTSTTLWSPAA